MVTDKTFSIRRTWILIETRIDTVLVSAGLVSRTLWVSATSNHLTSTERIALISWQTSTVCSVLGWITLGKSSTGILHQTRIDTFSFDTRLSVSALIVRLTTDGFTGYLRIAHVAWRTNTDRSVVLNKTLSSTSTVTWIFALSVDAGLTIGTVVISGTSWRVGDLNRLAPGVSLRLPAWATGTDHGSEGQTVDHGTDGGHVTW